MEKDKHDREEEERARKVADEAAHREAENMRLQAERLRRETEVLVS